MAQSKKSAGLHGTPSPGDTSAGTCSMRNQGTGPHEHLPGELCAECQRAAGRYDECKLDVLPYQLECQMVVSRKMMCKHSKDVDHRAVMSGFVVSVGKHPASLPELINKYFHDVFLEKRCRACGPAACVVFPTFVGATPKFLNVHIQARHQDPPPPRVTAPLRMSFAGDKYVKAREVFHRRGVTNNGGRYFARCFDAGGAPTINYMGGRASDVDPFDPACLLVSVQYTKLEEEAPTMDPNTPAFVEKKAVAADLDRISHSHFVAAEAEPPVSGLLTPVRSSEPDTNRHPRGNVTLALPEERTLQIPRRVRMPVLRRYPSQETVKAPVGARMPTIVESDASKIEIVVVPDQAAQDLVMESKHQPEVARHGDSKTAPVQPETRGTIARREHTHQKPRVPPEPRVEIMEMKADAGTDQQPYKHVLDLRVEHLAVREQSANEPHHRRPDSPHRHQSPSRTIRTVKRWLEQRIGGPETVGTMDKWAKRIVMTVAKHGLLVVVARTRGRVILATSPRAKHDTPVNWEADLFLSERGPLTAQQPGAVELRVRLVTLPLPSAEDEDGFTTAIVQLLICNGDCQVQIGQGSVTVRETAASRWPLGAPATGHHPTAAQSRRMAMNGVKTTGPTFSAIRHRFSEWFPGVKVAVWGEVLSKFDRVRRVKPAHGTVVLTLEDAQLVEYFVAVLKSFMFDGKVLVFQRAR